MKTLMPLIVLAALAGFVVCAQGHDPAPQAASSDKGIGPVKELKLGPIDDKLAARGKGLFASRCATCHALDKAMTGPALGNVLKTRTPEYVMNMILNTAEMEAMDPAVKKLASQFDGPMPAPGLSQDEARAVVEYLRAAK